MITTALQWLKENLSAFETFEEGGRQFSDRKLHLVPNTFDEPVPDTLKVNTLTGLRDYLKDEIDGLMPLEESALIRPFIHVVGHNRVDLLSTLFGANEQRMHWMKAVSDEILEDRFLFGTFLPIPQFIIGLQANFVANDDREAILQLVSNLRSEQSQQYLDNGYTQEVTAKRGTSSSLVCQVKVPNPVTLKPYRTFLEIDQPESRFVFRIKGGNEGQSPQCGLFEADGGAWKLTAIANIKAWLEAQELGIPIIA